MKPTLKDKYCGLWHNLRHPQQGLTHGFAAFGFQMILVKAVTHFLPDIRIEGVLPITIISLISIAYGACRMWKISSAVIKVPTTDTKIEVLFGNLFAQEGLRGIGMTRYFESEIGTPVSEISLHGQFLQQFSKDRTKGFDEQLAEQLEGVPSEDVEKITGKTKPYPIGTTALIECKGDKYIVFAFAEADQKTCKASSDLNKMGIAMRGLWARARIEAGGHPLNIPLIGSGLSGIGLPARELLNLIILSVITETKLRKITQTVRIILHRDQFEGIDLRETKKYWEVS